MREDQAACRLISNGPGPARLPREGVPAMAPARLREALRNLLGRNVIVIPMDLPTGCSAAWFGGVSSDWIGHARNSRSAAGAVAHAAGHLSLLHCGRIRDGGRFACVDAHHANRDVLYRVHVLLGEDQDLPGPLFTSEEEQAATSLAAAVLTECGYRAKAPRPARAGSIQSFQCVG